MPSGGDYLHRRPQYREGEGPWTLLWLVAFARLLPGLAPLVTARLAVTANGTVTVPLPRTAIAAPSLVLLGVLALRAAIIFSIH